MRVNKASQSAAAPILYRSVFLNDIAETHASFWEGAESPKSLKREWLAHIQILWAGFGLWSGRAETPSAQELFPNLRTVAVGTHNLADWVVDDCDLHRYAHIEHLLLVRTAPMYWARDLGLVPLEHLAAGPAFPNLKRLTVWQEPRVGLERIDPKPAWEPIQYPRAWQKTLERIEVWPSTRWTSADTNIGSCPEGPYHNGNSPLQWLPRTNNELRPDLKLVCKMPVRTGAGEQMQIEDALHIFEVAQSWLAEAWAQRVSAELVRVSLSATVRVGIVSPGQEGFVTEPAEFGRMTSSRSTHWKGFL